MTSKRASCFVGIKSWSWRTQRYSMNRRALNRTGSWMRKGPSYWITCTGPMGHRPVHPPCQINNVRLRTMWSSLLLCLLLTFSVGMIQSLGTLAQSQPLKRQSEDNHCCYDCDFFFCLYLWVYWLFRGQGCTEIQGQEDNMWLIIYDMGLWERISGVHYWLIQVKLMILIIPCEMGSCVAQCFEIFCPLLSHLISWTCSSTVLVPINPPH